MYSVDEGKQWFWSDGTKVDYNGWKTNESHGLTSNDTNAVYALIGTLGYYNRVITEEWNIMCQMPAKA